MTFRCRRAFARAALCLLFAGALSACVSAPPRQAYNREANAAIKSIALLPTRESKPGVMMMNHPGASFGLIGALAMAGDMSSKQARFAKQMAAARFDQDQTLYDVLGTALERRGYQVIRPLVLVDPASTPRDKYGLRQTYAPLADGQAQLDVNFGFVGYAAAGASDRQPYRPTVTLSARLVGADGKTTYFRDSFTYNNVFNLGHAIVVEPDAATAYPDFDALEAAGPASSDGLRRAIQALADKVAEQL